MAGDTEQDLLASAGAAVSGSVTTTSGTVTDANIEFYESCLDWVNGDFAGFTNVNSEGRYSATVAHGTYRILINPVSDSAADSWHAAKSSCDAADQITVSGPTTLDLVALGAAPSSSPSPTTSPTPSPTSSTPPPSGQGPGPVVKSKQSLKKNPPRSARLRKKLVLTGRTDHGQRVTWTSRSRKICTVKVVTVTGHAKGGCELHAKAPGSDTLRKFSDTFTVRFR